MNKLLNQKPILHAVMWILIYIITVNIGDSLSEQTAAAHSVTAVILLIFSAVLIFYLKKNSLIEAIGFHRITRSDFRKSLFYIPLLLLVIFQFSVGIDATLSQGQIAAFCLMMVGVGFVEEVIFRGFLYQAIQAESNMKQAILISGITFGIGHIVNLFRGYGYVELAGQILCAIAIGIVLALLIAITHNLIPGILFHILFNISGSITNPGSDAQNNVMLIAILIISAVYAIYLSKILQKETRSVPDIP